MYIKNTYRYKNVVEVERIHSGRYGKKTVPGARVKPTPEEMEKVNERNCIKKLRRKIQANFDEGDLFLTLTYRRENRPDPAESKKRIRYLLDRLRKTWKAHDDELKYIIVTEYMNVSIHHHLVLNDLADGTGAKKVNQFWKQYGGSNTKYLYEDGNYELLAAYLVKETNKSFREKGNPSKLRYSCSRNLVTPKAKTKIIERDDWPEEPRVPKGCCLDKQSLFNGVNKMGYRYQYYRLLKLDRKCRPNKVITKSNPDFKEKKNGVKKRQNHHNKKRDAGSKKDGPQPDGN